MIELNTEDNQLQLFLFSRQRLLQQQQLWHDTHTDHFLLD